MTDAAPAPRILFICTGNICRSPTAHALLAHRAGKLGLAWQVDSAAISDEEHDRPMDRRAAAELARRGVPAHAHRARQVCAEDFQRFDWIIGMTQTHCSRLHRLAPSGTTARIALLLDFVATAQGQDIPDPWYGGAQDFIAAFDLIDLGVQGLLEQLLQPSR
jgi:protein-tyrosine phosphatase